MYKGSSDKGVIILSSAEHSYRPDIHGNIQKLFPFIMFSLFLVDTSIYKYIYVFLGYYIHCLYAFVTRVAVHKHTYIHICTCTNG